VVNNFIDEVASTNRVVDLMKNNYGNYVVQKALKLSTGLHKSKLVNSVLKNLEKIGDRKLILKWKSIVEGHINNSYIDMDMNQMFSQQQNRSMNTQMENSFNQSFNMNNNPYNQQHFSQNSFNQYSNQNYVPQQGNMFFNKNPMMSTSFINNMNNTNNSNSFNLSFNTMNNSHNMPQPNFMNQYENRRQKPSLTVMNNNSEMFRTKMSGKYSPNNQMNLDNYMKPKNSSGQLYRNSINNNQMFMPPQFFDNINNMPNFSPTKYPSTERMQNMNQYY
jgi:hypothetical protein